MKRLGSWIVVLALELAVTTLGSGVAVVYMASLSGLGSLPDDPSPPPVTQEMLLATLEWQRSAFVYTFAAFTGVFAVVDLAVYFANVIEPGSYPSFSALVTARARARIVRFLLIMTFVSAWAIAWFTWLISVTAPRGIWESRLSWITAFAALGAVLISWKGGLRWATNCALAMTVALAGAAGVAVLRGTLGPAFYLGGIALLWLLLDKGIRAPPEPAQGLRDASRSG